MVDTVLIEKALFDDAGWARYDEVVRLEVPPLVSLDEIAVR